MIYILLNNYSKDKIKHSKLYIDGGNQYINPKILCVLLNLILKKCVFEYLYFLILELRIGL